MLLLNCLMVCFYCKWDKRKFNYYEYFKCIKSFCDFIDVKYVMFFCFCCKFLLIGLCREYIKKEYVLVLFELLSYCC